MSDRKDADMDGMEGREELGAVAGRKAVVRIYCMRKDRIFNKKMGERQGRREAG